MHFAFCTYYITDMTPSPAVHTVPTEPTLHSCVQTDPFACCAYCAIKQYCVHNVLLAKLLTWADQSIFSFFHPSPNPIPKLSPNPTPKHPLYSLSLLNSSTSYSLTLLFEVFERPQRLYQSSKKKVPFPTSTPILLVHQNLEALLQIW